MRFFGKGKQKIRGVEWDWEKFESTKDYPVSKNMLDWIIGQDKAIEECHLCLDEWIHKLKYLKDEKWFELWKDPKAHKPKAVKMIPAGPFLLLLGDAGTGKSLIGRALAQRLNEIYKKHNIELYDVLVWANKKIPSEPKISVHPSGEGRKIIFKENLKTGKRNKLFKIFINGIRYLTMGIGVLLLGMTGYFAYNIWLQWMNNGEVFGIPVQELYNGDFVRFFLNNFVNLTPLLVGGAVLIFTSIFIWMIWRMSGSGILGGIGGASTSKTPKLIIDNSSGEAPFIDATGHGSSQLFGSIAWDPYQTGGLGTPEHQRVSAGDVHRANLGILFIDELKNLKPQEAVTLLTILEDGQLPVTLRSMFHGGETAAMSVATEPVPALTFLVGAGNYDSIPMIHPALMDRIYGYGKVVSMNNDMPNTVENRRKYVQFICQEIKRFRLLPFSRDACIEVVNHSRRISGKKYTLSCRFRLLISIIKTSSILALNDDLEIVQKYHVVEAIESHCKPIGLQMLEQFKKHRDKFIETDPKAKPQFGRIYGLGVHGQSDIQNQVGVVLRVNGIVKKVEKEHDFVVTGLKKEHPIWINDSIEKVRSVIKQKYNVNFKKYYIHIDFSQCHSIDGPSAGVTMALLLASFFEKKPIRQDVVVTGEINIGVNNTIEITAVGGLDAKIRAAQSRGFKKVVIPISNYKYSVNPRDYKIKIVGGKTLEEYIKEVFAES